MADDDTLNIAEQNESAINNASTPCASGVFADLLAKTLSNVDENAYEYVIQESIYAIFYDEQTLKQVLACPEIANVNEDTTIRFTPIQYTFPGGRLISINYETQPKLLKQRILMATKRTLPTDEISPRIAMDDPNDPTVWVNTDPAWYGIMVVEAGSMDEYVGPDKNNTISVNYIADSQNIDKFYPRGESCTSRSAIARDGKSINRAGVMTTGNDGNDYYVAGDVNLEWIGYAEIVLEVAIAVVTMGSSAAISGTLKGAQVVKSMTQLAKSIKVLRQTDKVRDYIRYTGQIKRLTKHPDKVHDIIHSMSFTDELAAAGVNVTKNPKYISKQWVNSIDPKDWKKYNIKTKVGPDGSLKYFDKKGNELIKVDLDSDIPLQYTNKSGKVISEDEAYKAITDNQKDMVKNLKAKVKKLEKETEVKDYKTQSKAFHEQHKYLKNLKGVRAQHGNVLTRSVRKIKAFRAARNGGDIIKKGYKAARASTFSGRVKNWLFYATRRSGAALSQAVGNTGALYVALKFAGDMYDMTDDSTGQFTNDIDFRPLLLLSADEIEGQENVVNYGMWLMWEGNSTDPADDDAAYLQAMDFAAKFHEDLMLIQNDTNSPCNVDIYVVRPIIRGPDTESPELYYLIMNDVPWTTRQ